VDAVKKIDTIDRSECRRWVVERFSPRAMANGYEAVYGRLIEERAA